MEGAHKYVKENINTAMVRQKGTTTRNYHGKSSSKTIKFVFTFLSERSEDLQSSLFTGKVHLKCSMTDLT